MSNVVEFVPVKPAKSCDPADTSVRGEIVIFPGIRIEREQLDLGHRLRDAAGHEEFQCLDRQKRPRKSY